MKIYIVNLPFRTYLPALVITVALIQSYFTFRWGTKFMLSMVIGEYSEPRLSIYAPTPQV